VSWFNGDRDPTPDRVNRYPLAALADDVRALVQTAAPKGRGAVLCGAVFGAESPETATTRRRAANLLRATLVHVDVDGGTTLGAVVRELSAAGLAFIAWPSPSATRNGLDAERVRAMVQLAPDAPEASRRGTRRRPNAATAAGRRVLAAVLRGLLPGARIDAGTMAPTALAFVHPRAAPRPASSVIHRDGDALDLAALAHAAADDRVIARPGGVTRVAEYDADALRALIDAAPLARSSRGGVEAVECPDAVSHSDGRGVGRDTSCALHREGWTCSHQHEGRGPYGTATLVRLTLARVKDSATRERLDAMLHGARTLAARVREAVETAPSGVESCTVNDVVDLMLEAARHARREADATRLGAAIFAGSPGVGKSAVVAWILDVCAPPPSHFSRDEDPADGPKRRAPVAAVLVDQRARIDAAAAALWHRPAGRRYLPMVHMPVSLVLHADGRPVCIHHAAAVALERAGGSARDVLCVRGRCPRTREGCEAHEALHPHPIARIGAGEDTPRVIVATHAVDVSDMMLQRAALVTDEAHGSPWEGLSIEDDAPEALTAAATLVGWP
jgi:hypothetical protein